MSEGFLQVPVDGAGKKVEAIAVIIPKGTIITASDGTTSELAADTVYYRQVMSIGDPSASGVMAEVKGHAGQGALAVSAMQLDMLEKIHDLLGELKFIFVSAIQD